MGAFTDYMSHTHNECDFEGGMTGAGTWGRGRGFRQLDEESDVRSGHHFLKSWLIWRQIVLFL